MQVKLDLEASPQTSLLQFFIVVVVCSVFVFVFRGDEESFIGSELLDQLPVAEAGGVQRHRTDICSTCGRRGEGRELSVFSILSSLRDAYPCSPSGREWKSPRPWRAELATFTGLCWQEPACCSPDASCFDWI